MIFVDTGAWFASVVPTDPDHAAATVWLSRNTEPLVTTDFVIDETLTLLKVRGQMARALAIGKSFFDGSLATVHYLTEAELRLAWDMFRQFTDKDWSFTDCTSKILIEQMAIQHAFAFDHHFRQFGTVVVVP